MAVSNQRLEVSEQKRTAPLHYSPLHHSPTLNIQLKKLIPQPLEAQIAPTSEIWDCEQVFEKGKAYFVSAASGKGKTTLQHILYGLRKDFSGQAQLGTRSTRDLTADDWAILRQQTISVVFQDLRLFLDLTGWENLQLKNNLCTHLDDVTLRDYCARLGVADFLETPCGKLSYGQRQRIAIIRALCQPFEWLILDEPFSHLDDQNIAKATELIQSVCKTQNAGLILASLGNTYGLRYDKMLNL